MIKAIIFDLDDTLFPEHAYVLSGFQAVDAWLRDSLSTSGFDSQARILFEAGTRGNIFNLALEAIGLSADPMLVQELVQVYRAHAPRISLHDDARWALQYLKPHVRLGIITDGYLITQQRKVEALGIADDFDCVIYSDQYGRESWKPSPVPYLKSMEMLACRGEECVYVGDNPRKDFVTARQLGWRTVHIQRAGGEYAGVDVDELHRAHHAISSLYELEALFPYPQPHSATVNQNASARD